MRGLLARRAQASTQTGLASALQNIVWWSISGICFYGRGEIDSAPRSCCGFREKTPLNFLQRVVEKLSNAVREGRRPKRSKSSA